MGRGDWEFDNDPSHRAIEFLKFLEKVLEGREVNVHPVSLQYFFI